MLKINLCFLLLLFQFQLIIAQGNPEDVQIVRDSFGVPHIFGKTDIDVAYGLAWATAEDDFNTLQWTILAAKNMQGRYYGADGAKVDYVGHLLRARKIAEEKYEADLSSNFKKMISAYALAINNYARQHPKEVLVKEAFPVTEIDMVTGYVLSFSLMSGIAGVLEDIISGNADKGIIQNGGIGSNAFALNSSKTKDGSTYLAVNSHQPLEGPLSWYEVHLHSDEGWNIIGGTFHGGISVFHGTNPYLGWAHTVNFFDAIDTYQLTINPKNKNQYQYDGKWENLEVNQAVLKVKVFKRLKLKIKVKKKVYWSKYGAVLKSKKGVYAIRLAANQDIRASEQWYKMNKAKNFSEFYEVMRMNALPRMTTVYADKYDTIFAISTGRIPLRNPAYNWMKILPGNTSKTLWNEYHPIEDLPQLVNPKCGFLFNSNNSAFDLTCKEENLTPEKYDTTMGFSTLETHRSKRVYELLDQFPSKISYEDFKKIKFDKSMPETLVSFDGLNFQWFYDLKPENYPDISSEINAILKWNKTADLENKEAAILFYTIGQLISKKGKLSPEQKADKSFVLDFYAQCIRLAKKEMMKSFGTTILPLKEVQRHTRGNVDLPVDGGPDMLKAAYSLQRDKKNRLRITVGESYIQLVQFTSEGPKIETINAYGSSAKPNSPHYTDQMQRYVDLNLKPMTFDKSLIIKQAELIYHPK